jgi:hypothetical protein
VAPSFQSELAGSTIFDRERLAKLLTPERW